MRREPPQDNGRSRIARAIYRLRTLLERRRAEQSLRQEIEFHLDMETEKYIAEGLDPKAARLAARKAFGGLEQHKETLRDGFGFPRLEQLVFDARIALRGLRRAPLFAGAVIVTLALGIGASTSIFSAVHEVLLRPLPYPDADRLAMVYARHQERGLTGINVSYPDYLSWAERNSSFESMAIYTWWSGTLGTGSGAERIAGAQLSANALEVLGVQPALGRGFRTEDTTPGAEPVLLLSHGLWQRRHGADPEILGHQLRVDGQPHTVIGIMPPGFRFPNGQEVWLPMVPGEYHGSRITRFLAAAVGRLGEGVDPANAQAELETIGEALQLEFPATNKGWDAHLVPLRDDLVGPIGPGLLILQGAVLILLLIICGNVGGLILARSLSRSPEFALRQALGARRGRLLVQIATESLVLGGLAAIASLGVLWAVQGYLQTLLVDELGLVQSLELGSRPLLFLGVLTLVSTVLFGLAPALGLVGKPLRAALGGGGRALQLKLPAWGRSLFVVGQLALVMVLLVASVLLMRTLYAMERIDPGFRTDVLTARLGLPAEEFPEAVSRDNVVTSILERLEALPSIERAGVAQGTPFSGWNVHQHYQVLGEPEAAPGEELSAFVQAVHPGFFDSLGVPIVRGRNVRPSDRLEVVVNESFVRRHFAERDALGQQIEIDAVYTVVGVVADYRHFDLLEPMRPAVYLPWSATSPSSFTLTLQTATLHTAADPQDVIPELRQVLAELVPNSPPYRIDTLADAVRRQGNSSRMVRNLLASFAGLSVLLAILGLYATIVYTVQQRRREFGLRIALGATPHNLSTGVLYQGLGLVGGGILVGIVAGLSLTRFLESFLFAVEPGDPWTFAVTAGVVFAIAALATWVPARQAARNDPMAVLRSE